MPQLNSSNPSHTRGPILLAQGERPGHGVGEGQVGTAAEHGAEEKHAAGEVPAPDLLFMNSVVVALFMVVLASLFSRKLMDVPRGIANMGEWVAEQMRNFTVGIIGPEGEKHTPLIGTVFFYILLMNLIGLIPGFHSPTGNVTITLALGVVVFLYVQYWGIRNNGFGGYLRHFMGPSLTKGGFPHLFFLLGPIELLSEAIKPFTLAIRLFGNIFGEDVILVVLAGLGATFGASFLPIHFPVMLLSLITALVQAMVFSILTCIYLSLLSPHDHHDHDEAHGHGDHSDHGAAESLTV